jgi:hypothetical protein
MNVAIANHDMRLVESYNFRIKQTWVLLLAFQRYLPALALCMSSLYHLGRLDASELLAGLAHSLLTDICDLWILDRESHHSHCLLLTKVEHRLPRVQVC